MTERALNRHVLRYFPLIISPFMLSNKVSALIATCSKVRPNKSPGTKSDLISNLNELKSEREIHILVFDCSLNHS